MKNDSFQITKNLPTRAVFGQKGRRGEREMGRENSLPFSPSPRLPFSPSQQRGSAMVIALLVLALVLAFVALAVSRTTNETIASSNDAAESRAFAAAQASLEVMTRNFDKIFEEKLSPLPADLTKVKDKKPDGFDAEYSFVQNIQQTQATETVVVGGGLLQGLNATRDAWQVETTAADRTNGVEVSLKRQFFNDRVPIFQFGIFYDDDLEFHPGPRFDFGGRVHSNANMFMMAQTGLYFSSRVSAAGQILTDVARNGKPYTTWGENVWIKNSSGSYVQLKNNMGSVLKTGSGTGYFHDSGTPKIYNPDMPTVYKSTDWANHQKTFGGNLLTEQRRLDLPLVIASRINGGALDYIELIKRGKNVGDLYNDAGLVKPVVAAVEDTLITSKERYANKKGIRISLADSKARLPGCASGTGTAAKTGECGKRLDGDAIGDSDGAVTGARGYQPLPMSDGYQATRVNGNRLATSGSATGRQVWIKIETVGLNAVTNSIETKDITADILSLGVTEPAPFTIASYGSRDSRSVVKLQRFAIPGVELTAADTAHSSYVNLGGTNYNVVVVGDRPTNNGSPTTTSWTARDNAFTDDPAHYQSASAPTSGAGFQRVVVPFPIKMFDTREGLYNDDINVGTVYSGVVPENGVMSLIDIDVANLKKFLDGNYNTNPRLPAGTSGANSTVFSRGNGGNSLKHTDVPEANGWVLYVSDRRGDADFDGEYDMEDIYGNNDGGSPQPGEDVNFNGTLDANYASGEAVRYSDTDNPAFAATIDHQAFRRGVRLINGQTLPGKYDAADSLNTRGFTVASENAIYVKGNYNAYGIDSVGTPTPSDEYNPQNTADHIPASVVGDAVIILSNNWSDSRSFRYPFTLGERDATETFVRFAMLAGDARSSFEGTPNQGGGDPRLAGGVHNFKRFLEDWSGVRLNYVGSLINLYNARNNNGAFKCCSKVYSPPTRNWVFDATFLDPTRLPPGTPFFQNIQLTGFQRVN